MPVIVGGILGMAGALIGTVILHRLRVRRIQLLLFHNKLEEIIILAYRIEPWLVATVDAKLFGRPLMENQCPIFEIKMISGLYLPQLRMRVNEVDEALVSYSAFLKGERDTFQTIHKMSRHFIRRNAEFHIRIAVSVIRLIKDAEQLSKLMLKL